MIKKLLLIGLICLPGIAKADDLSIYNRLDEQGGPGGYPIWMSPVKTVDHIQPIKDYKWQQIKFEYLFTNNFDGSEIANDEEKQIIQNAIEPEELSKQSLFPNVSNENVIELINNIQISNDNQFFIINNLKIRAKKIAVKKYRYGIFNDYSQVCHIDIQMKYQYPCGKKGKTLNGYQIYLIPDYSNSITKKISLLYHLDTINYDFRVADKKSALLSIKENNIKSTEIAHWLNRIKIKKIRITNNKNNLLYYNDYIDESNLIKILSTYNDINIDVQSNKDFQIVIRNNYLDKIDYVR